MYGQCHKQIMVLDARPDILDQYKELNRSDLKISMAITEPNARGHRDETLAWFWTMDVPKDAAAIYCVNWLRKKALCERWQEEVQLLTCEREWTRNFFDNKVQHWTDQHSQAISQGNASLACYAAKQCQMY
ncbi:hypothetical protein J3A83DRAFT_4426297, partial [Scleroderma citrinum]